MMLDLSGSGGGVKLEEGRVEGAKIIGEVTLSMEMKMESVILEGKNKYFMMRKEKEPLASQINFQQIFADYFPHSVLGICYIQAQTCKDL